MTTEESFKAAVNVIRSLPKNGSYQPSYDLMLRFYAFYKQATEGPCKESQPAFWEVVKKKKWEAWTRLGNMSRQEAMESYVEELKKIVETMSYTDNVADFIEGLGSFYEAIPQNTQGDLQMLVGDVIERVSSRGSSPRRSEPSSTSPISSRPDSPGTDSETEEFIDTVEAYPESEAVASKPQLNGGLHNGTAENGLHNGTDGRTRSRNKEKTPAVKSSLNGHAVPIPEDASSLAAQISLTSHAAGQGATQEPGPSKVNWGHVNGDAGGSKTDVAEHLRATIKQLQRDLERVTARVRSLEVAAQPTEAQSTIVRKNLHPSWWPFSDISPRTAAFVVAWPFIVHVTAMWWRRRRNRP